MRLDQTIDDVEKLIEDSSSVDNDSCSEYEISESDDCVISNIDSDEDFQSDVKFSQENPNNDSIFSSPSGLEWSKRICSKTKTKSHNIVTSSSGILDEANNITSIFYAFELFMSDDIINEIVKYSNKYCEETNPETHTTITKNEIKAFIGILIAAGSSNGKMLAHRNMWDGSPLFKQLFFPTVMSRNRFTYIYRKIRFDDKANRIYRFQITNDKFEPCRQIFDLFNENCLKYYSPGTHITVDERLVRFRGKCPFRVYMKSKPGRFGIKLWVAADVETSYLLNIQPYTGKIGGTREINQAENVVTRLVSPFYRTGRGVTVDNFFTSVSLATKLFKENLALTGTIRSNKRDIPKEFLKSPRREVFSSLFGFSGHLSLSSYVPKKNYAVNILSTEFHDSSTEGTYRKRPTVILHYNKTKGGVDNGDKMTQSYSCSRPTRRWPLKIFMEIIDMAALNAYIIWIQKNSDWKKNDRSKLQKFIRELAIELAIPNVAYRRENSHTLQSHIKYGFQFFEISTNNDDLTMSESNSTQQSKRNRCHFCPRNKDKKSSLRCFNCLKFVCIKHRVKRNIIYCLDCTDSLE